MYSAVHSLSVSFGNVQCSSVQISLERCSDCPVWYFPVPSRVVQCSVVQSGNVKLRQRQSSPVRCSAVQFSLPKCCPAQSSPVQSTPVHSTSLMFTPVQFNPVQSH